MAGRQFQKLLKQQEQLAPEENASDQCSVDSDDDLQTAPSAPFNPFDLLNDEDDYEPQQAEPEDDDAADAEEDVPVSSSNAGDAATLPVLPPPSPALPNSSSKKKKKKNKGGKGAGASSDPSTSKSTPSNAREMKQQQQQADDDIDAILQELNIGGVTVSSTASTSAASLSAAGTRPGASPSQTSASGVSGSGSTADGRPLLAVDVRALRPEEELKRIFGARVVEAARAEDGGGDAFAGASRRVRRLAARGLIRMDHLKPGTLISPKDTWPRPDAGALTLKPEGPTPEGKMGFTYEYSPNYQAVQALYEQVQQSMDPNAVAALLQAHPYHLDALLTMADLYRSTGENAYADEMTERCVYALELAWPATFTASAAAGTAHVPYEEANLPLFIALFRYIQSLGRRGLHRTALEVCKLLLSLNADDPMGVLLCIDYFAVRAGQYGFLYSVLERYNAGDTSVALLPNMAYSIALAKWYQEREKGYSAAGKKASGKDTGEDLGLSSWSSAQLALRAVLLHPLVIVKLQRKVQEAGVYMSPAWTTLLASPFFSTEAAASDSNSTASLSHLVSLFVERQSQLWKAPPVQAFLLEACTAAVAAAGGGLEVELPDGLGPGDWGCVRQEAFPPSEVNAYRHLRMYEFTDTPGRLPVEELHGGPQMGAAGGAEEVEARVIAVLEEAARRAGIERVGPEELAGANPLVALLRSFLPWVAMGEQPDYGAGGAPGAEGEGGGPANEGHAAQGEEAEREDDRHAE